MANKKKHWREQQTKEYYYQQAKAQGYRSRAAFKLLEINDKYHLLKPKQVVLDLGAAPGGWSQVAKKLVGKKGIIVAVDCLEIKSLEGVDIIQGDLREQMTMQQVKGVLGKAQCDLVISDMAPNLSGVKVADQHRSMDLAQLSVDIAKKLLKPGGVIIIKLFQGVGFDEFVFNTRKLFKKLIIFKPKASSVISREVYCVGTGYTIY